MVLYALRHHSSQVCAHRTPVGGGPDGVGRRGPLCRETEDGHRGYGRAVGRLGAGADQAAGQGCATHVALAVGRYRHLRTHWHSTDGRSDERLALASEARYNGPRVHPPVRWRIHDISENTL